MNELEINPQIKDPVLQERVLGKNLVHAPQPALTVADTTAFPHASNADSVTSAAITTLDNMRTRIAEIEAVLIKLGLLRKP